MALKAAALMTPFSEPTHYRDGGGASQVLFKNYFFAEAKGRLELSVSGRNLSKIPYQPSLSPLLHLMGCQLLISIARTRGDGLPSHSSPPLRTATTIASYGQYFETHLEIPSSTLLSPIILEITKELGLFRNSISGRKWSLIPTL